MNNYTPTQEMLHRLALSSRIMREVAFDVEQFFVEPDPELKHANHVFIAGMARSGTTILLRELHETGQLSSLTYMDMPFVMSPNLWSRIHSKRRSEMQSVERAHGDGLRVNDESPEAFEEVFWKTFLGSSDGSIIRQITISDTEVLEKFQKFVGAVIKRYGKIQYLSKNNSNVFRLNVIRDVFSRATILIPFRSPVQHAGSLLAQHARFRALQREDPFIRNYMDWLGHNEFGLTYHPRLPDGRDLQFLDTETIEHWLEQWLLIYQHLAQSFDQDSSGLMLVCYETLCEANSELWQKILTKTELKQKTLPTFSMKSRPITQNIDQRLLAQCEELYEELKSRMGTP